MQVQFLTQLEMEQKHSCDPGMKKLPLKNV